MTKKTLIIAILMAIATFAFSAEWTTKERVAEITQNYEIVNTRQLDTVGYYKKVFNSNKKAAIMVKIAKDNIKAGKPSQIVNFDNGDILVLTFTDDGKTLEEVCYSKN